MKRPVLIFLLLLFLLKFPTFSFAQTQSGQLVLQKVSYDLPYPGVLPNNPLYFLKAVRDNLLRLFITDPLKRGEYDLLQSDKRLVSAQKLLDLGNVDLSITTLSKSVNYLHNSVEDAAVAKTQGEDVNPFLDKLLNSSIKHEEIIFQMIEKTKGSKKETFQNILKIVLSLQSKVEQIKSK